MIQNGELQQNLEFLGLDLEKLPKFINDANVPTFSPSRFNNDKDLKIYKFVPINEIEILLTPCLRSDDIQKKYAEALPLKCFLNMDGDEQEIALFKTFSKIVRNTPKEEIEKVKTLQEDLNGKEPFKVKYKRDHLWQIYYSEESEKYFMLVCTKEQTFAEFLYLLKSQIDFSKKKKKTSPKIYVPINCVGYTEQILKKSEITDIENYLWLFTKNWPLIFEVYNDKNEVSLQVVGETFVYRNIKSSYKVVLKSTEEAIKFYKLLKALFILQTEIKGQYTFDTKVDSSNGLSMYLSKVEITFNTLTNFIKNEFLLADYEIKNQNKEIVEIEQKLEKLKNSVKEKEEEYLQKQKEISTYLECKKTFIGKMKYFFKSSKKNKKPKQERKFKEEEQSLEIDTTPIKTLIEEKEYYTIEDLVTIYALHERGEKQCKNLKQDAKALELKLENLISKVRNANQYIEEIDKHKRSIFDFWKFANKDEKLALEMAEDEENENQQNAPKKSFDFEMDFEKVGEEADKLQRKKLSHEENDSAFMAQTELLYFINRVRLNKIVKYDLEDVLAELKEEFNEDRLVIDSEVFDIFGNISENNNQLKYIGSRSHRESEKSKFKIMNINKKIDVFDFTEKMQGIVNFLEGAIPKIPSLYDMPLYKLVPISKNIEQEEFALYNMNIENELEEYEENGEGAYNLISLNYKEGMPLLYYTNAMFYDNGNKTLPLGMNLSSRVLVDNDRLEFVLVNKTKFRTNSYFNHSEMSSNPKSKDIFVYEYDVFLKDEIGNTKNELMAMTELHRPNQEPIDDKLTDYEEEASEEEFYEMPEEEPDIMGNLDNIGKRVDLEEVMPEEKQEESNPVEVQENEPEPVKEEVPEEKKIIGQSKKLLKIQQKLERELEKQRKKEEKAKEKLRKKNKK